MLGGIFSKEIVVDIEENGLESIECQYIEEFIEVLTIIESCGGVPGVEITEAAEDDDLNEGETYNDLTSGEVTHYCAKTYKGDKFIHNDKLEAWANEFLIDENGRPMNLSLMEEHGFHVYAGEADCFGWLTGVIKTDIGELVFG